MLLISSILVYNKFITISYVRVYYKGEVITVFQEICSWTMSVAYIFDG